jgi:hypothetical protein
MVEGKNIESIVLINSNGKTLKTANGSSVKMNLDDLSSGVYYIILSDGNGNKISEKLIKK